MCNERFYNQIKEIIDNNCGGEFGYISVGILTVRQPVPEREWAHELGWWLVVA